MPFPAKPCGGRFSDELQAVLTRNSDRAQWANHRCEACGLEIGAVMEKGRWVPEQHWPTVKHTARIKGAKKTKKTASESLSAGSVLEESFSG